MTRQPHIQTSQARRHTPKGFVFGTLVGLSALGWTFAEMPLDRLVTYVPLVLVALSSYLVLRTQYSR